MKLTLIYEVNITKTNTAGKIGKAIGGEVLGAVAGAIPGVETAKTVGKLTLKIIDLIKNKKRADKLIMQAMSLPDSDRDELNIFDIDDNLWGPDGLLSEQSQTQVFNLVQKELAIYIAKQATLPPNFANAIAIKFIQSKIKPNSPKNSQAQ